MGCKMTKTSKKYVAEVNETHDGCPSDLDKMKRKDLQKLCKSLKLKAIGKNVELVARIRGYYNELELKDVNNQNNGPEDDTKKDHDITDASLINKAIALEDDVNKSLPEKDLSSTSKTKLLIDKDGEDSSSPNKSLSNTSSPKDWNWLARWCVVDGVLKQDAKDRWVLLQLIGGRTVIVDDKTKEKSDFVLEPTILSTPEDYEDNYICGDCVRKNHEKLSGWIGITKTKLNETPKSSLCKENCNYSDNLLRQSFKRKREDILSPPRSGPEFIEIVDSPLKVRRLNPRRSASPASPHVRRQRGEDFQLPKNLLKPWKPKKTKNTPPKEDPDFAQKVEKIITDLSPDEQLNLVFGAKKPSVMHSPQPKPQA